VQSGAELAHALTKFVYEKGKDWRNAGRVQHLFASPIN